MIPNELVFLIIGIVIGVGANVLVGLLRRHLQHALAIRKRQVRYEEDLAQKRSRQLRSRVEQSMGKNGWELDIETVYAALFSENGFNDKTAEHLQNLHKEEAKNKPSRTTSA